jgi:hypothetical protein
MEIFNYIFMNAKKLPSYRWNNLSSCWIRFFSETTGVWGSLDVNLAPIGLVWPSVFLVRIKGF